MLITRCFPKLVHATSTTSCPVSQHTGVTEVPGLRPWPARDVGGGALGAAARGPGKHGSLVGAIWKLHCYYKWYR